MSERPAIPRELRRRVLLEAGHRCAIPTCRTTPVEVAHIIPWSKVKKHEFKNLIALCPTCHTRFDDPHNPLDRKAMRQYKANLNPLLSLSVSKKGDQIMRIAAYQDFRMKVGTWLRSAQALGLVKSKRRSTAQGIASAEKEVNERFADALISGLDFNSSWKGTYAEAIAGAIFYHIADWVDELFDSEFPAPRKLAKRDVVDELSEASINLHLAVCEEVGILEAEDTDAAAR
ncbi:HNH endonuclease [Streptomyces sp. uw30]|uniref:HNH endonuclease n=1 Tax=Streptomyces sp. uw30 TaxID=1828179 RepID=UPI0011CD8CE5|nr:HNH endonuclease signature motif containing protein [Streptomyces sp. uw30]TXS48525.1 HNH endonuclease [Streptomyces sp. uw30]